MESSSEDSRQEKEEEKPVSRSSLLADFSISSSSDSGEERPRLASFKGQETWSPPHSFTTKASTPQTSNSRLNHSTRTRELQELQAKTEDQKAAGPNRETQDPKLTDLGLDYGSGSSDTDQEVRGKFLN